MRKSIIILGVISLLVSVGCNLPLPSESSDKIESKKQEQSLQEMARKIGLPAITNFAEKKLVNMIMEMRDRNEPTFTYSYSEMEGKFRLVGNSIGYGIPAATQYTNPDKIITSGTDGITTIPQADPNGLFSPDSADGTWILLKDPNSSDVKPVFFEPRMTVSPFRLPANVCY